MHFFYILQIQPFRRPKRSYYKKFVQSELCMFFSGHMTSFKVIWGPFRSFGLIWFIRTLHFLSFLQHCRVEAQKWTSLALSFCLNFGLTDLISINRDIKSSLYWTSVKLASRVPVLESWSKLKVIYMLGIYRRGRRTKNFYEKWKRLVLNSTLWLDYFIKKQNQNQNFDPAGEKISQKFGSLCSEILWSFPTKYFVLTWEKRKWNLWSFWMHRNQWIL